MSTEESNPTSYEIDPEYPNEQFSKLLLSAKLGLFTLLNGKKWYIYAFLAFLPILISLIAGEYLFGNENAETAFIDMYIGFFYIFMFTFGTLLISLPVSADEITDNLVDLYLVRPIRRDIFWTSRWLIVNLGVFIINVGIVTFYWIYFHVVDEGISGLIDALLQILLYDQDANHIGSNVYWQMIFLVVFATFVYSGIFLLVGSMGSRGFTMGMMLALLETFFISLLFLQGSEYIPRTHLNTLAYDQFGDEFQFQVDGLETDFSTTYAYIYVLVFGLVSYFVGMWNFKRKEFN